MGGGVLFREAEYYYFNLMLYLFLGEYYSGEYFLKKSGNSFNVFSGAVLVATKTISKNITGHPLRDRF